MPRFSPLHAAALLAVTALYAQQAHANTPPNTLCTFAGGQDGGPGFDTSLAVHLSTLYGSADGGSANFGRTFKLPTTGVNPDIAVNDFQGSPDGAFGQTPVYRANTLYGTTHQGGSGHGTVFKKSTSGYGLDTLLHSFAGAPTDGDLPEAPLVFFQNHFYGTTRIGGASNNGTIFRTNANGSGYVKLYDFVGGTTDGCGANTALAVGPAVAPQLLYATTTKCGSHGLGSLYSFNPANNTETMLYSFGNYTGDGVIPEGPVIYRGGKLFGTTRTGGSMNAGTLYSILPDGTNETIVHAFGTGTDGNYPTGPLVASGSHLYGTTRYGGASGLGTIYRASLTSENVVWDFTGGSDGGSPEGGLIKSGATGFGTTTLNTGTVFSIPVP
jgi:uncharacterized repeat protein (TIGR03803 family)